MKLGQRMNRNLRSAVLLVALPASGCLGLAREAPQKNTFALEVTRPPADIPPSATVLMIEPFRVAPLFADRAFVYRTDANVYASDFYNEFLARPEEALTEIARAWFQAAGIRVVAPGSRVEPTHFLEVDVDSLFGDYAGDAHRAVLAVRATLIAADEGQVLWQRAYRAAAPLADDRPATLAAGWSEALRSVLTDIERDLRPHLL